MHVTRISSKRIQKAESDDGKGTHGIRHLFHQSSDPITFATHQRSKDSISTLSEPFPHNLEIGRRSPREFFTLTTGSDRRFDEFFNLTKHLQRHFNCRVVRASGRAFVTG